jgi:hypothetical protein
MPVKGANFLSGCYSPQFDAVVNTGTGKRLTIRAESYRMNRIAMPLEGADFLSGCQIPEFYYTVNTATGKGFSIGTYGDRPYRGRMLV